MQEPFVLDSVHFDDEVGISSTDKHKNEDVITEKLTPKKINNEELSPLISKFLSERGLAMFEDCATANAFASDMTGKNKKLMFSNSCTNRFCPICSYRKSRRDGCDIGVIMEAVHVERKKQFLFLTLTTPNVTAENLVEEINLFNAAIRKMFAFKEVDTAIDGYVRKLEITYNEKDDTYNPHAHLILAVNSSYFKSRYYIKQARWLELWRRATGKTGVTEKGHDEITQLHIKRVIFGDEKSRETAINEVAKYSAKDTDLIYSEKVFENFYLALKGRQLLTFTGIFKEYRKKLRDGELEKYIKKDKNYYVNLVSAFWGNGNYERAYRKLTEKEEEHINQITLDEYLEMQESESQID